MLFFSSYVLLPLNCSGLLLCSSELDLKEVHDWMVLIAPISLDSTDDMLTNGLKLV